MLWVNISRNSNSHMDHRKEVLKLIVKSAKLPKSLGVLAEVLRRKYNSSRLGVLFLFRSNSLVLRSTKYLLMNIEL